MTQAKTTGRTKARSVGVVEGLVQVAALELSPAAADLVVLALHMVVTEGAGADIHCVPAGCPVLHQSWQQFVGACLLWLA